MTDLFSRYARYIKFVLGDASLCAAISLTLSRALCRGVYIPAELVESLSRGLPAAVFFQWLFHLCGCTRKSAAISLCLLPFVLAAATAQIRQTMVSATNGATFYSAIFYLSLFGVSLSVFLLSRSRAGAAALFLLGSLCLAAAAFLQYSGSVPELLLFLCGAGVLFMYKVYQSQLFKASATRPAQAAHFLWSGLVCLLAAVMGMAVHTWIIRPLDPPTRELKLVARLMSFEVLQRMGVASRIYLPDPALASGRTSDNRLISPLEGNEPEAADASGVSGHPLPPDQSGSLWARVFGGGPDDETAFAVRYKGLRLRILRGAVFLLLTMAALPYAKFLQRRLWRQRLFRQDLRRQIGGFYAFFLRGLRRMGWPAPVHDTPIEYAERFAEQFREFFGPDRDFRTLSRIFSKYCYGAGEPTVADRDLFLAFYRDFYANCRRRLGAVRYALLFFFL